MQQGINIIILECNGVSGACHCCSEPAMAFSRNRAMHALETLIAGSDMWSVFEETYVC